MRILITGSRNFFDADVIMNAIVDAIGDTERSEVVVVHGAAVGADTLAGSAARTLGVEVEEHRAKWGLYGNIAGYIRNQEMVDCGADVCLAFPVGESRGTRHCIRTARKAGIPVVNITEPKDDGLFDELFGEQS